MKSQDLVDFLNAEFQKDPVWSKAKKARIAEFLNVSQERVYKWHWEMARSYDSKYPGYASARPFKVEKIDRSARNGDVNAEAKDQNNG